MTQQRAGPGATDGAGTGTPRSRRRTPRGHAALGSASPASEASYPTRRRAARTADGDRWADRSAGNYDSDPRGPPEHPATDRPPGTRGIPPATGTARTPAWAARHQVAPEVTEATQGTSLPTDSERHELGRHEPRLDDGDAYEHLDDEDLDSPEQHQTHDVIITEIEEINLTDYMQTLRAPTFSEEALATADFGFGGDRVGSQMNGSYIDTASSPKPSGSAGRAGGAMGDKVPVRTETPGRAGRRVWSRGGNRSSGGGMNAVETPGIDRPQTGGLDEADVNRPSHGLDDDEDGGDSEVDADIFDDSDDDSWGEETHAVDTFGGGQTSGGVLSDDEDGGHAASPKAMGAINPSFGVSSMATKSPSTAAQFSGFVSGGGKSLPGRQSPHPGSSFAASREARRRREEEGDFVVMSTPSGLRRVPSARRRPGSGASGAGSGGGARAGGGDRRVAIRRQVQGWLQGGGGRRRLRRQGERVDAAEGIERGRDGYLPAAAAEQATAAARGD